MIGHLSRQSLKLDHTFSLEVLDCVAVQLILRMRCGPGNKYMLKDLQHESWVLVKDGGRECHEKL